MKKDEIHEMIYGTDEDGRTIYCFELNESQDKYLHDILENDNYLGLDHNTLMRIIGIRGQGYYFYKDVDFLNGLKEKLKTTKYRTDHGFYIPTRELNSHYSSIGIKNNNSTH